MMLVESDVEASMKVVVVGNGSVGKTSLIKRFCNNVFSDEYKKTIGVDFLEKEIMLPELNQSIRIMLWDTAGQEEFDAITSSYYRGADAAVVAFATDNRESFEKVRTWHQRVQKECGNIPIVLIQNKVDVIDQSQVRPEEPEQIATDLRVRLYRTSVKQNLNVEEIFRYLATCHLTQRQQAPPSPTAAALTAPPRAASTSAVPPPAPTPAKSASIVTVGGPAEPAGIPQNKLAPTKRRGKDGCTLL